MCVCDVDLTDSRSVFVFALCFSLDAEGTDDGDRAESPSTAVHREAGAALTKVLIHIYTRVCVCVCLHFEFLCGVVMFETKETRECESQCGLSSCDVLCLAFTDLVEMCEYIFSVVRSCDLSELCFFSLSLLVFNIYLTLYLFKLSM